VIAARAADPALQDVPGGKTGLIVRDVRGIGKGANFQLVAVYAVDVGLLAEMRQIEKQAAQEVGQWVDRNNVAVRRVEDMTDEELLAIAAGGRSGMAEAPGPDAALDPVTDRTPAGEPGAAPDRRQAPLLRCLCVKRRVNGLKYLPRTVLFPLKKNS
jgi:hypothetical protein